MAAVETYRYTLERIRRPRSRSCLEDCMQSHARRVQLLRRRIQAFGGEPTRSAGTWGILAMSTALAADMIGSSSSIAALELGESHGQLDYMRKLPKLDAAARAFVEAQVIPAQLLTHEWISDLKRNASPAYAER